MSLLSNLVMTPAVVSAIMSGAVPPEAPTISSQELSHNVVREESASNYKSLQEAAEEVLSSRNSSQDSTSDSTSTSSDGIRTDRKNNGSPSNVTGVDISSHQHKSDKIDIPEVVDGGQGFGFVKATEGLTYINPHFRTDVIKFMKEDTPVGFYHYARPTKDTDEARNQARFFVAVTGIDQGVKSLPPVLDIEEAEGLSSEDLIAWTSAFVDEIQSLTGRDPMIYTYQNFWRNDMGNTTKFSELPLWLAQYTSKQSPDSAPGGWKTWDFWQYTSSGKIPGYDGKIDLNLFNGSKEDLEKLYQNNSVSTDNVEAPDLETVTVTTTTTVTPTPTTSESRSTRNLKPEAPSLSGDGYKPVQTPKKDSNTRKLTKPLMETFQ